MGGGAGHQSSQRRIGSLFAPWEIGPGDVWVRTIEVGLKKASSGVLVVSPTSLGRPWVQEEYAALLDKAVSGGGLLVPVLLEDAELSPFVANRQYVDFRRVDGPEYANRVQMLIAALKSEWSGRPPRQPGALIPPPGSGYRAEGPIFRTLRIEDGETVLIGDGKETRASLGRSHPCRQRESLAARTRAEPPRRGHPPRSGNRDRPRHRPAARMPIGGRRRARRGLLAGGGGRRPARRMSKPRSAAARRCGWVSRLRRTCSAFPGRPYASSPASRSRSIRG